MPLPFLMERTMYHVVLRSLKADKERVVLESASTQEAAEQQRAAWRKILGNKNWTINRRPGVDSLDHLILKVEKVSGC